MVPERPDQNNAALSNVPTGPFPSIPLAPGERQGEAGGDEQAAGAAQVILGLAGCNLDRLLARLDDYAENVVASAQAL